MAHIVPYCREEGLVQSWNNWKWNHEIVRFRNLPFYNGVNDSDPHQKACFGERIYPDIWAAHRPNVTSSPPNNVPEIGTTVMGIWHGSTPRTLVNTKIGCKTLFIPHIWEVVGVHPSPGVWTWSFQHAQDPKFRVMGIHDLMISACFLPCCFCVARAEDANVYFVGPDMDSYRDAIQEVAVHRAASQMALLGHL